MTSEQEQLKQALSQAWDSAGESGANPPRWEDYLPAQPVAGEALLSLLELDIQRRAAVSLPGLIVQRYWEHPLLSSQISDEQKVGLIQVEVARRSGLSAAGGERRAADEPAQRLAQEYAAAFPELVSHDLWKAISWNPSSASGAGESPTSQRPPQAGSPYDRVLADLLGDAQRPAPQEEPEIEPAGNKRRSSPAASPEPLPERFGRYRVIRALGRGGFGNVYQATDEQLDRDVAIKVTLGSLIDPAIRQKFLVEARTVAALDHPQIVPVYDVGQTETGDFFVVSKLIDGTDLSARLKLQPPERLLSLRIVEGMADALQYAHSRGLVHRDVKPANILLDRKDRPYLTDFGIALRESELSRPDKLAGTPAYMSPEQARGEGHRVDHRSDIYSLGVVLYELLTGRRPFRADNPLDLMLLIATEEVRSPRLFDETISPELERVCLKALCRRASDRFTVARDFAEEIRWLLANHPPTPGARPMLTPGATGSTPGFATPPTPLTPDTGNPAVGASDSQRTGPTRVVPKGLRSFDAADASFFLELLPGPFDRDGLPESLRFWKTRIEETDPEKTFKVGLVYGPSGCGKSSLMKAGLLPRLNPKIITVYLEATSDDTEARLLRAVRKAIPDVEGESLKEVLSGIRRRKLVPVGGKLLLVLDQFEQWLFTEPDYTKASLTEALRQCDGNTVQAIVMVRDDFWLSVSRFLRELEVSIERNNSSLVDLFDLEHASKVLGLFGKAYGRLPESTKSWTKDQNEFLRQSVHGLSQERKVISVRIAVLAEMLKSRDWTTAVLREVGGIEGVGATFLEEMFGSKHAPIHHRPHQEAVRGLLSALLPATGTDIKGSMQSAQSLQNAGGYEQKPRAFQELMTILDQDLRLITPVDDGQSESEELSASSRNYQLAHDYMVPALREWLTRKQRETKKGRAELKLAERTAAWSAVKETKQLPTLGEWLRIRSLTERAKWKPAERLLMLAADRMQLTRLALAGVACAVLLFAGLATWRIIDSQRRDQTASSLVATLQAAEFAGIPAAVAELNPYRALANPKLAAALEQVAAESPERLKLSLGLLGHDPAALEYVAARLPRAEAEQVPVLVALLGPYKQELLPRLWEQALGAASQETASRGGDSQALLPLASALAAYDPQGEQWPKIAPAVADRLVRENALRVGIWIDLLRPAAGQLNPELKQIYAAVPDAVRTQTQIDLATEILETFAASDFSLLHELILSGRPEQFARMFNEYEAFRKDAVAQLQADVARSFVPDGKASAEQVEQARLSWIARQANAAVALLRLEDPQPVYQFLTVDRDPEALSQFIYRIRGREVSPTLLISSLRELYQLAVPGEAKQRQQHYLRIYGFLLGLGECTPEQLPNSERGRLIEQLSQMYRSHPSRAVHSAVGWLLRRWGQDAAVKAVDEAPLDYDPSGEREWYVIEVKPPTFQIGPEQFQKSAASEVADIDLAAPIYFTMIVFPGGEFEMGDPGKKTTVTVAGPLAVTDREVTWRQVSPFDRDASRRQWMTDSTFQSVLQGRRLLPDEPVLGASWIQAVNYCRWLTEAKMPGEQNQSYQRRNLTSRETRDDKEKIEIDGLIEREWRMDPRRPGFRLLTGVEWEYIARGGMETEYSFGTSDSLLSEYGWFDENSGGWSHCTGMLRPSVAGLFDIHGNLWELTDDFFGNGRGVLVRGGGWGNKPADCRSARRGRSDPLGGYTNDGGRLALCPSGVPK